MNLISVYLEDYQGTVCGELFFDPDRDRFCIHKDTGGFYSLCNGDPVLLYDEECNVWFDVTVYHDGVWIGDHYIRPSCAIGMRVIYGGVYIE